MAVKAYVICDITASCVPWEKLYDPNSYQLILMLEAETYNDMVAKGDLKYFSKHYKLPGLEYSVVRKTFIEVLAALNSEGIPNQDIMIVNNDELLFHKCAKLRDEFNVQGPTFAQVEPFRNKVEAKKRLKACEQFLPRYMAFDCKAYKTDPKGYVKKIIQFLGFPIFAKPIDLAGSLGTGKISNEIELNEWCVRNQDNEFMELDQFLEGTLYHCESLIANGKILRTDVGVYLNPCGEFLKGKPLAGMDLHREDPFYKEACEFNETILKHLTPPDGCTHLEFFKTPAGKLIFLECAARTPGAAVPECRKNATGVHLALEHCRLRMGLKPDNLHLNSKPALYYAWIQFPRQAGVLAEQFGLEPLRRSLQSKVEISWGNKTGDLMKKPEYLTEWACSVTLSNSNYEQLRKDFETFNFRTLFTVASKEENEEVQQHLQAVKRCFEDANTQTAQEKITSNKLQDILNLIKAYSSNQIPPNSDQTLILSQKPAPTKQSGYVNDDPNREVQHFYRRVYNA